MRPVGSAASIAIRVPIMPVLRQEPHTWAVSCNLSAIGNKAFDILRSKASRAKLHMSHKVTKIGSASQAPLSLGRRENELDLRRLFDFADELLVLVPELERTTFSNFFPNM